MLGLNDAFNACGAEDVGAGCDCWFTQVVKADGALFARVNTELQHILQCLAVLRSELYDLFGF